MVQALSTDLRQRIVEDVEGGLSRRGTARKYRVSASSVVKLLQRYAQTGSYTHARAAAIGAPIWRRRRR